MKIIARLLVLAILLVTGCDQNGDGRAAGSGGPSTRSSTAGAAPPPEPSERTWAGLLPCSDCQGIATRLLLRSADGKRDYLLSETYLGGTGTSSFKRVGTWTEQTRIVDDQSVTLYLLDSEHSGQGYALQEDGALEVLDGDGRNLSPAVVYRLQRQ